MCKFFSFVTEPEYHGGQRFYFDWNARKNDLKGEYDSHSVICKTYSLDEDKCNKFEFNPLTKEFIVDQINSSVDDTAQAHEWVEQLDFKRIIEPLIIKSIINPFLLPAVETVTDEQIELLKQWASVGASARSSAWDSVGSSIGDSAGSSVWASVWDSVWASVWDSVGSFFGSSVGASVWAYTSSFFNIQYKFDFTSCKKLWEDGLVPSYDGTAWRLHTGSDAHVVYELIIASEGKE
jgi:hypothetical protein